MSTQTATANAVRYDRAVLGAALGRLLVEPDEVAAMGKARPGGRGE